MERLKIDFKEIQELREIKTYLAEHAETIFIHKASLILDKFIEKIISAEQVEVIVK